MLEILKTLVPKSAVGPAVRSVAMSALGGLVVKGYFTNSDITLIAGACGVLGTFIWTQVLNAPNALITRTAKLPVVDEVKKVDGSIVK